jgi:hypothetical protein
VIALNSFRIFATAVETSAQLRPAVLRGSTSHSRHTMVVTTELSA